MNTVKQHVLYHINSSCKFLSVYAFIILGGCLFIGPLSGTKYPTRAASPIQNASTPKSSLPFSKHRCCALLCAGFSRTYTAPSFVLRLFLTKQVTRATHVRNRVCPRVELILKIIIILLIIFLGFIKSKPC